MSFEGILKSTMGRNRGAGRGHARRNRSKTPDNNNNQAPVPKIVRGRVPRRYDPVYKQRSEAPKTQNMQYGKNLEKSACSYSDEGSPASSSVAHEAVPTKTNTVASNLSSASLPFYPSGASSKDQNLAPKMEMLSAQPSSMFRGKGVDDSLGLNKLHLEDMIRKPSDSSNLHHSGFTSTSKGAQVRTIGSRQGFAGHKPSPSVSHTDHANKVSGMQLNPSQQRPSVHNQIPPRSQGYVQPSKHSGNGSQTSLSPTGYASMISLENADESQSELGKAKKAIVPNTESAVRGSALGPFMYNGGQIMGANGNTGIVHGDPNFPTFLPVMQFGAQHPGGIGVPAVGMAFPVYVQPQNGQGSSEMTWLPVLAGATGALEATYCPPYRLDGATYNSQLTALPVVASSSNKEANTNNTLNEYNPSQKHEHGGEEFDQRQNKPRRYSEMKFGQ